MIGSTMTALPPGSTARFHVRRDIPYAEAPIGHGTARPGSHTLLLDAYLPAGDPPPGGWPALVLSHGGAFHRGAKDRDEFEQDGTHNTPVHGYCERFAARGYACFSVGYRLTQALPPPPARPVRRQQGRIARERIDHVRQLLGLPPAGDAELVNGAEAAYADVAAAFGHLHAHAARWGIDPERMAIGGFSAGAIASAYAVFAFGMPAAAIVSLSGGMDAEDAEHYVHGARGMPPVLMFTGEHDLPSILERSAALAASVARAGLGLRHYKVPGKPHFYDSASPIVPVQAPLPGGQALATAATVEEAMQQFLDEALQPPTVDAALLEAFAQAWCRHDIDALMACMADDCVFHTSAGPEASGTRHIGRDAVRTAFMKAWADVPDAQWTRARHVVAGRRGMSEWTFVGTRASDGQPVVVDGCDIFTFHGGRIRVKDSFRKQRA